MKNLIKLKNKINLTISSFSKKEYIVFCVFSILLIISVVMMLQTINKYFMVNIPTYGGSISEGVIGSPRFINPILAFPDIDRNSEVDQDLVMLIYSGLMRKNSNGDLMPDLAEKYPEISNDNLTYTFTLKDNLTFHDGKSLTTDDIFFTINALRDPLTKNPNKKNWENVKIEIVDKKIIKFILKKSYSSFLENTTFGIMPKALWENSPIELNKNNIKPIGSGPFKISKINKEKDETVNYYELESFKKFALGEPYLKKINLYFYSNEDELINALQDGEVDQISSISPENAKSLLNATDIIKEKKYRIETSVLPRIFGIFLNQNQNQIFTNKNVVKFINQEINKNKIIEEVLMGYGTIIDNPIPENILKNQNNNNSNNLIPEKKITLESLSKDGWKKNKDNFLEKKDGKDGKKIIPLEFSISTRNIPEFIKIAELIKNDLEKLGIKINIKTFEINNLNQDIIRPRRYDSLLFGQNINDESDLLAFWHSSQRKDPGLNIAMYTNIKADKFLEEGFVAMDQKIKMEKYNKFREEVKNDMPVIFLYSPNFIYLVSKNLLNLNLGKIISPANRFSGAHLWYTEHDKVWKIFTK
jgi:peptide/nickel transport system substrate-binding protein